MNLEIFYPKLIESIIIYQYSCGAGAVSWGLDRLWSDLFCYPPEGSSYSIARQPLGSSYFHMRLVHLWLSGELGPNQNCMAWKNKKKQRTNNYSNMILHIDL